MQSPNKPAYLLLQDGSFFTGASFGAEGTAAGELCFNTGMTGYQEIFTDPSYTGQVLIMNQAHIGNYGVKPTDVESDKITVKAVINRNLEQLYHRPQATDNLKNYFEQNNIVAITGVDTRAMVNHVRNQGAMNCIVSTNISNQAELMEMLKATPSMQGQAYAQQVSTSETYFFGNENSELKIAVLDFGVKRHILQSLADRGAYLKVFNSQTNPQEILNWQPHGIFISNGPGDPAALPNQVQNIKTLLDTKLPFFGICLGQQLMALAVGIGTYKLHHGHRGINHPVLNLITGRSEITTQNHGFGINPTDVKNNPNIKITHVNLNDETIEGIKLLDRPAFTVQYHPESTPGPHDSRYLFDEFIQLIKNQRNN
jgi:carbamoyl-phosphate synthase small subunit